MECQFRARALLPALLIVIASTLRVPADEVYLKDGTVLLGQVVTARKTITDASGTYDMPAGDGTYAVYDGCRIVVFSRLALDPARLPALGETRPGLMKLDRPITSQPAKPVPPGKIEVLTEFDANLRRKVRIKNDAGFYVTDQVMTLMTPYQLRISSLDYAWGQNFLTDEMDREYIKGIVARHPQFKNETDPIERQMRVYRFVTEAKWYDECEKILTALEKDPKAKERVEKARESLRLLQAESTLQDVARAMNAGQLRYASLLLSRIPPQVADGGLNVRVNTVRVKADNLVKQMEQARRYLRILPDETEGPFAEVLTEAAQVIRDELHVEGLDRLEPFLALAEQAERAKAHGRVPTDKAEHLLARAVSGWLLGKQSSEGKPESAYRLWKARRFAIEYLRTNATRNRNALLELYEKGNPVDLEELARIISLLPPPEADEETSSVQAFDRKTQPANAARGPVDYKVQLPIEYTHGKPHPLLVVLHNDGENLQTTINRYRYDAVRQGFILVAAEWGTGFGGSYNYTADEHLQVLDVIRDVRMRFNVDTDRVFIGGFGEGGSAALDIGLSHPDVFAGIVPMCAQPRANVLLAQWPNAMYTPIYAVTGEMMGYATRNINRVMRDWVDKGFPCLHCVYRGRGYEWFGAELPLVFDWMARRRRTQPFPELGRWPPETTLGTSLCTVRQTDNRFYWLSTDGLRDVHLLENKASGSITPARMQGVIRPGNQIVVASWGLKQVTIWLGPNMIDFSKPVSVRLVGAREVPTPWTNGNKPLKPSLSIMMEDLYERMDRTRLFVAQIRLTP